MSAATARRRQPEPGNKPAPKLARPAGDRNAIFMLVLVATLVIVGLGAVMSASSVVAFRETGDKLFYFKRQVIWTAAGVVALLVASRVPYQVYRRLAFPIYAVSLAGLVAVLAIGVSRNGATRWIEVGGLTVQPSEFSKFATVVFLAAVVAKKEKWIHEFPHFVWPVVLSLGTVAALVMAEPDLGTTLLIGASAFAILVASRTPLRFIFGSGLVAGAIAFALAFSADYRWRRVTAFLDPLADPLDSGLQAVQARVALGTGGWFGVGLGASRARWSFLPNAHTDFIFAIIGEEAGFAGSAVIVLLFVAFAVVGTVIALRTKDRFGRLLAVGLVTWISVQALVNIGGVIAVLPITGVPLPFISSGGTAMVTNLAVVGVLVNIARSKP